MINSKHWLELSRIFMRNYILPNPVDWFNVSRYVIGIMTGTSVDRVDIILAKFLGSKSKNFLFSIVSFDSYQFPDNLREQIEHAISNQARTRDIAQLNFELAFFFAKKINEFLIKIDFPKEKLDAIGVHGQTVWHEPKSSNGSKRGFTLQLLSLSALAQLLQVPIVGDFRAKDVAAGGEGAPLVPIFDYEFLANVDKDVIAVNIGGIANITFLPKNVKLDKVVAFDTGPGNVWIDGAMKILFGKDYDNDGNIARKGNLSNLLFKKLKSISFVRRKPPKSTGREFFNISRLEEVIDYAKTKKIPNEDIITTLTHYTAWSISENIKLFANPVARIIVSGGGAKNSFILELLCQYLPQSEMLTSNDIGIPVEAKESLAFAFLAYLRIGGLPSNIPNVTGAREKISLGIIAL